MNLPWIFVAPNSAIWFVYEAALRPLSRSREAWRGASSGALRGNQSVFRFSSSNKKKLFK